MDEPIVVNSRVDRVQLYRAGAVVTRRLEAPPAAAGAAPSDPVAWAIDGLPLTADDASVTVRVTGADCVPVDVDVSWVLPPLGASMHDPDAEPLAAQLRVIAELQASLEDNETERALYEGIAFELPDPLQDEPPRAISYGMWQELAEHAHSALARLSAERLRLQRELRQAELERAKLDRALNELQAARTDRLRQVRKRVSFRLLGQWHKDAVIELDYKVNGARWSPSYVLRLSRDGAQAELSLRALVAQSTGEAWEQATLSFSTAELMRVQDLPELKSLRIGRQTADPARPAFRAAPSDTDRLFESLDAALQTLPKLPSPQVALPTLARLSPRTSVAPAARAARREQAPKAAPPPQVQAAAPVLPSPPMPMMPSAAMPGMGGAPIVAASSGANPRGGASMPAPSVAAKKSTRTMSVGRAASRDDDDLAAPSALSDEPFDEAIEPAPEGAAGFEAEESSAGSPSHALRSLQFGALAVAGWSESRRGKLRTVTLTERLARLSPDAASATQQRTSAAHAAAQAIDGMVLGAWFSTTVGGFDYRYDAEARLSVPSDGRVHTVAVLTRTARAKSTYIAVPRESTDVVRVAKLTNPLSAPLLPGPAEIYLEDEFLVTSQLDMVPAGGEVRVGLGVEPAIKVARNARYAEEVGGLLRGALDLVHDVSIEVASRLPGAVAIEVRERVPVVRNDDKTVAVEVSRVSPPWQEFKQLDVALIEGGHMWALELPAGASVKLEFQYKVRIDAKLELVGGNRREV